MAPKIIYTNIEEKGKEGGGEIDSLSINESIERQHYSMEDGVTIVKGLSTRKHGSDFVSVTSVIMSLCNGFPSICGHQMLQSIAP